jgi:endo-1,4-beta-xylanase
MMQLSALTLLLAAVQTQVPAGTDLLGQQPMRVSLGTIAEGAGRPQGGRIKVLRPGKNGYEAEIKSALFGAPVKKGDVVYITYRARAVSAANESSTGSWGLFLQRGREPWDGFGTSSGNAGKTWRNFHNSFVADKDYDAETLEVTFHVGGSTQELEFDSLRVLNLGASVDISKLPHTQLTYEGREANAPWRKRAAAMIERNRKGDLTVVLKRRGRPLANQTVRVQMLRHAYPFGTFSEYHVPKDDPNSARYRELLASRWFSRLTVPIYWADWGWASPQSRKEYLDTIAWCLARGIRMKAHTLLWPSQKWSPSTLKGLDDAGLRRAIFSAMDERIAALRKFDFENVDVLNELKSETEFGDRLGFGLYTETFARARRAWPKADLVYNDYGVFEGAQAETSATDTFERIARRLKSEGAPLTKIGLQGHFGEDLTPPVLVWKVLDRFQRTIGLPVELTEFDIDTRDERAQADYTRDLMTAWFAHPSTSGFTAWGFWEGSHWKPNGAMFRKDWSPKPNAKVWEDLVTKQWWTDATVKTDAQGRARLRGFLGDYKITAGGKSVKTKLERSKTTVTIGL